MLKDGRKVSVVAVNRNEEKTIKKVLTSIPKKLVDEVLVVDGHSTDNSVKIAKKLGFKVIQQKKMGRGQAFREGFEKVKGGVIIMLSTDGNERPAHIPRMLEKIEQGYDLVIASRFGRGKSFDATPTRIFGNHFLTLCCNLASGLRLTDSQNGFRAFTRQALEKMKLEAIRFDIEAEISVKAGKLGLKVAEVPTIEDNREAGQSYLNTFRDGFRIFKRVIKETLRSPPY